MPSIMFVSKWIASLLVVCFMLSGISEAATEKENPNSHAQYVTVLGKLNDCYKFKQGMVYLESEPSAASKLESELTPVDVDNNFKIEIPATGFRYGGYYLKFGEGRDKAGFGAMMIDISSDVTDVGTLGECDL